jgi:hypothetical protein
LLFTSNHLGNVKRDSRAVSFVVNFCVRDHLTGCVSISVNVLDLLVSRNNSIRCIGIIFLDTWDDSVNLLGSRNDSIRCIGVIFLHARDDSVNLLDTRDDYIWRVDIAVSRCRNIYRTWKRQLSNHNCFRVCASVSCLADHINRVRHNGGYDHTLRPDGD